jgi:hypothetical protein
MMFASILPMHQDRCGAMISAFIANAPLTQSTLRQRWLKNAYLRLLKLSNWEPVNLSMGPCQRAFYSSTLFGFDKLTH